MNLLSGVDSPKALRALPEEALPALCAELREVIVAVCGRVGGHLGASLGVVELTVALHRVFKSPVDRLVFDVGHQAYAHKLLTGRAGRIDTLRQAGGLAPFLDPSESEHDAFAAGHACTAISAALGLLEAKRQLGQPGHVVAVVGDGALTGGLAWEGLNNVGHGPRPLVVVLNDNGMSISENVGAVPRMLEAQARSFFEALGFVYLGPVDGHDLGALAAALRDAKASSRPTLVHVRTRKGQGFAPAEDDARTRGHAMGPWELRDGKLVRSRHGQATWSDAFAAALAERMAVDPAVVAVTPAMLEGSSLVGLAERFPGRVYDVGIAEQHAVTFAAGLARGGLKPVVCIYSTFLQRGYDSVVHDVALSGLPVVFAVDRAGVVGADGATHQGAFDVGFLRAVPGLAVRAPVFAEDLAPALASALARPGPTALRFPRTTVPTLPTGVPASDGAGARWLRRPAVPTLHFLTFGPLALAALEAASDEPGWGVVDVGSAEPLPPGLLEEVCAGGAALVTVEEGTVRGGFGSAVLEGLARAGLSARVRVVGLPGDRFVRHGEARALRHELGLDAAGLAVAARGVLSR